MLNEVTQRHAGQCLPCIVLVPPRALLLDIFDFSTFEVLLDTLACHSTQSGLFLSSPAVFDMASALTAALSQRNLRSLAISQVPSSVFWMAVSL
jgi:hypothetical protein